MRCRRKHTHPVHVRMCTETSACHTRSVETDGAQFVLTLRVQRRSVAAAMRLQPGTRLAPNSKIPDCVGCISELRWDRCLFHPTRSVAKDFLIEASPPVGSGELVPRLERDAAWQEI